jgi:integrase
MPKTTPKVIHRQTPYPGICKRWSVTQKAWLFGVRVRGEQHSHPYLTLDEARTKQELLAEAKRNATRLPAKSTTLDDLIAAHLMHLTGTKEHARATRVLNTWAKLLPAGTIVTHIETPHLQKYIDHRKATLKGSSIDREMNIIVAALNAAGMYFPHLRQWVLPPIPRPKYNKATTRVIVTDAQYSQLCDWFFAPRVDGEKFGPFHARQRAGRLFRFMMLSGCRTGEACALTEADIQPQYQRIQIRGTKTDKIRFIALTPYLHEIVAEQIEQNKLLHKTEGEFIFVKGGQPTTKIYTQWARACEACGIAGGKHTGFTFYSARHTVVTDLLMSNAVDIKSAGSYVGHARVTTTQEYTHLNASAMQHTASVITDRETQRRKGSKTVDTELTRRTPEAAKTAKNAAALDSPKLYGDDWI